MIVVKQHIVKALENPTRLLDYCYGLFEELPSKKGVKKAVQRGEIQLNTEHVESGRFLKEGDVIQLCDLLQNPPKPYRESLKILYQDDYLSIVYKPSGIPVHGNQFRTLQNVLVHNIPKSPALDALPWPKPVHRLDSATQGLVVVARTQTAIGLLGKIFEKREINKIYVAVISGELESSGLIELAVENKEAKTSFETLKVVNSVNYGKSSLVKLVPHTGRTHQLRIHTQQQGVPIIGDKLYGEKGKTLLSKGLFLAALELSFVHPITNELMNIKEPIPTKFTKYLEREEERWNKYNT